MDNEQQRGNSSELPVRNGFIHFPPPIGGDAGRPARKQAQSFSHPKGSLTLSPILNMSQGEPWESPLDGASEDFVMAIVSEDVHGLPREQVSTPRGVQHHRSALDTGSAPRTPVNLTSLHTPVQTPYSFPDFPADGLPPPLPNWAKAAASEQQATSEYERLMAANRVFATAGLQHRQSAMAAPPFPMMAPPFAPQQQQHRPPPVVAANPFAAPGVILPAPHATLGAAFHQPPLQASPVRALGPAGATPTRAGAAPNKAQPVVAAPEEVTRISTRPDGALNAIVFAFTLRRADDVKLGLEVSQAQNDRVLKVQDVLPNGAIDSWNRQAKAGSTPWKVVTPGDLVVQVNQVVGCEAMLRECGTKQLLQLTLVRETAAAGPQESSSSQN